jgi:hypothetical protein
MKYTSSAALGFILFLAAAPAFAQMSMGGGPGGGAGGGAPGGGAPTPQARVPDIAPPALPGAGDAPIATGPKMTKPLIGDPTQALFAAVNSGDYNAAQDAISRGANLTAQDPLGETPLDLAVSLNRTNITFLLLESRNETGGDETISPGPAFTSAAPPAHGKHKPLHAIPASDTTPIHATQPAMGANPGTPNPAAGFLGFGSKS